MRQSPLPPSVLSYWFSSLLYRHMQTCRHVGSWLFAGPNLWVVSMRNCNRHFFCPFDQAPLSFGAVITFWPFEVLHSLTRCPSPWAHCVHLKEERSRIVKTADVSILNTKIYNFQTRGTEGIWNGATMAREDVSIKKGLAHANFCMPLLAYFE